MYKYKYIKYKNKYINLKNQNGGNNNLLDLLDLFKNFFKISGISGLKVFTNDLRTIILCGDVHEMKRQDNTTSFGKECDDCTLENKCIYIADLPQYMGRKLPNEIIDFYVEEYYDPIKKKFGKFVSHGTNISEQAIKRRERSLTKIPLLYKECLEEKICDPPNMRVHATDTRDYRFENLKHLRFYINNIFQIYKIPEFNTIEKTLDTLEEAINYKEIDVLIPNITIIKEFFDYILENDVDTIIKKEFARTRIDKQIEKLNPKDKLIVDAVMKNTYEILSDFYNENVKNEIRTNKFYIFLKNFKGNNIHDLMIEFYYSVNDFNEFIHETSYFLKDEILYPFFTSFMDAYTVLRMHKLMDGKVQNNIIAFEGLGHIEIISRILKMTGLYKQIENILPSIENIILEGPSVDLPFGKVENNKDYNKCLEII